MKRVIKGYECKAFGTKDVAQFAVKAMLHDDTLSAEKFAEDDKKFKIIIQVEEIK